MRFFKAKKNTWDWSERPLKNSGQVENKGTEFFTKDEVYHVSLLQLNGDNGINVINFFAYDKKEDSPALNSFKTALRIKEKISLRSIDEITNERTFTVNTACLLISPDDITQAKDLLTVLNSNFGFPEEKVNKCLEFINNTQENKPTRTL